MPNTTIHNTKVLKNISNLGPSAQSILDVFVLQDILDIEDAEKIKSHYKTNREIENFLIKNRLVTRDSINKAYSILLKLPYLSLKNVEISENIRKIIPKALALKYRIIPFDLKDNLLRLAIAKPSDLIIGYPSGLIKILDSKNLGLELFITGDSDFNDSIKQYDNKNTNQLLIKKGSLPVVNLRNVKIPEKYLSKIPKEYIAKYRLVIFDQNVNGDYLIACEQPDNVVTKKVIDYLKKENNIELEVFATSKEDIDYVLNPKEDKKPEKPETNIEKKEKTEKNEPKKEANKEDDKFDFSFGELFGANKKKGESDITVDSVSGEQKQSPPVVENKPTTSSKSNSEVAAPQKNISQEKKQEPNTASSDKNKSEKDNDSIETKDLGLILQKDIKNEKELNDIVKEGYIPKIVAAILNFALNKKVSDIHFEPQSKVFRVRFRIDGVLVDVLKMPLDKHPPIVSRIKIMSKLKIDETRIPQDGRFEVVLMNREIDVRVSSFPTVHGEKIVLRVLDKSQKILSLEDLGMKGEAFDKTMEAITRPWGIILSTGPTGSGKSTTLNAIINRLNKPGVNIITLEDPVEYETPGVNQCQVKPDIGFTFASGLRSVLRQDPNIIMVGEIRDKETASMATHAALTGHLVLSTLHTNDTSGTLPRLINMGIEPFLITSSTDLIIAQRLVRLICPKCKEETKLPSKLVERIKSEIDKIPEKNVKDRQRIPKELKFYYGKGCSECSQGFKGRIGIFEVMVMTPEIEELAIAKRSANEIKESAIKNGMLTMEQDGILKALQGLTTIDEVLQATTNK